MSRYLYQSNFEILEHITLKVMSGDMKPIGLEEKWEQNSLHDKDQALETLLKTTARVCKSCGGLAIILPHQNLLFDCTNCDGEAEVCAWCHRPSQYCHCAEEKTND